MLPGKAWNDNELTACMSDIHTASETVMPVMKCNAVLTWMMFRIEIYLDLSYSLVRACAETMMFLGCSSLRITSSTALQCSSSMLQTAKARAKCARNHTLPAAYMFLTLVRPPHLAW